MWGLLVLLVLGPGQGRALTPVLAQAPLPGRVDELLRDIDQKQRIEGERREQEARQAKRKAARSRRWSRVWRSALWPWWGQETWDSYSRGEKGWVFLNLLSHPTLLVHPIFVGAAVLERSAAQKAYEEHRQAKTKAQADEAWDRTMKHDNWTVAWVGTAGGWWLWSMLDAIFRDGGGDRALPSRSSESSAPIFWVGLEPDGPPVPGIHVAVRY